MGELKKVLQINTGNFGSTGNIMMNISKTVQDNGYVSYVAYASSRTNKKKKVENSILIGSIIERNLHLKLAYYTGHNGCFSKRSTIKFIKQIDILKPDIIHIHNLHNCYINLKILFDYIKEKSVPVIWTLHDCWSFTGQCPYFTAVNCVKWKTGCYRCPQYTEYPKSRVDRTNKMYSLKKEWFTGVKNLMIVTPSQWLAGLVSQSFLMDYTVKVINNGIDLNTFKPVENDFRNKHGIQNEFIILGVASPWSPRKGLATFIELSKRLDESCKIVLVGLTDEQIQILPQNILGLTRTNNAKELAEIYSASSVFVNPTLEDNFPTTNLEAIACGTPVITFNTGGSAEALDDSCGTVVEVGNINQLIHAISQVRTNDSVNYTDCCRARAKMLYDHGDRYKDYLRLYSSMLE